MTRVNVVPVSELADQHLFAEFRELKMVPRSLNRSLASKASRFPTFQQQVSAVLCLLPVTYRLGAGHVSFFYDKGLYLQNRYSDICRELARRGVNYDANALLDPLRIFTQDARLCKDYTPTPEALAENRARINERLQQRPGWYRWTNCERSA